MLLPQSAGRFHLVSHGYQERLDPGGNDLVEAGIQQHRAGFWQTEVKQGRPSFPDGNRYAKSVRFSVPGHTIGLFRCICPHLFVPKTFFRVIGECGVNALENLL